MILNQFPDLEWLRQQSDKSFANRQGWAGRTLPSGGWPNVVLNVKADNIFRDNIRGPLSIFSNITGESYVQTDKNRVRIPERCFYVTNNNQRYTLEIDKHQAETFNIHFGEYFTEQVFHVLSQSASSLLEDDGCVAPLTRINFYNNLHIKTQRFENLVNEIKCIRADNLLLEEKLFGLMSLLLETDKHIRTTRDALPVVKEATRQEIIKRLLFATDYIYSNYQNDLSLEALSAISCLSKFHFLRLFKIAFRQTPHQFINALRITRAKELLRCSQMDVRVIGKAVGFNDASSFSRMFFNQTGVYPTQYR